MVSGQYWPKMKYHWMNEKPEQFSRMYENHRSTFGLFNVFTGRYNITGIVKEGKKSYNKPKAE
jgi:hypothetical protein